MAALQRFFYPSWSRLTRIDRNASRRRSERGGLIQTGAVVCAALGIDTDLTLIYQLFALLVCLIVASRVSLRFLTPSVRVSRRLPRYATAGEPFTYHLLVENTGTRVERDLSFEDNPKVVPPSFELFASAREPGEESRNAWDRAIGFHRFVWLQRRLTGITTERGHLDEVGLRGRAAVSIEATPLRRGTVQFESITTRYPDPMGLHYGISVSSQQDELIVLPRRYRIDINLPAAGSRHFQPGGVTSTWSIGESDEFVSLREYRDGDSIRKIHWPSTARRGKPVVREYQDEYFSRELVVLDAAGDDEEASEVAISVAASLLSRHTGPDGLTDLLLNDRTPRLISTGRGLEDTSRQLEALAVHKPAMAGFEALAGAVLSHARRVSGCYVVLARWDEPRARMCEQLHTSSTVFVVTRDRPDPLPGGLVHVPAAAPEAALAAAVAPADPVRA